jgi:Holliday junction resolvasome RuvABC endonuclease subunit
MVILSIDQALQISGYAVFENNKLVEHGTFSIPKSKPIEQRLGKFLEELTNLYHRYEFEKIIFEDIQEQHKNVVTFKHLAYVQATILN